jgi:hypothetical protein
LGSFTHISVRLTCRCSLSQKKKKNFLASFCADSTQNKLRLLPARGKNKRKDTISFAVAGSTQNKLRLSPPGKSKGRILFLCGWLHTLAFFLRGLSSSALAFSL